MKKLFCIVSFLLVMTMLPVVAFVQTQEEWNIAPGINNLNKEHASSLGNQVTDTTSYSSYVVKLEVDGGNLSITIPVDFQYQAVELTELERYPFTYTFTNDKTGTSFLVQSALHTQKDQNHFLKKLYDKSNKFIVTDGVLIGEHTYLVYTKEQATYSYGFLVRTDNGYSYQFQYILPYDTILYEMPVEAISILSTLKIQESSEHTD